MSMARGTRLGPYEIHDPIGAGGMGEVYKATDTRLDRTVAIKILPDALAADPRFRERFDREARAISQLDHPHICALHDIGDQGGIAYLVLQYLEGDTLDQRLTRGPLAPGEALRVAIDLADALDKAHRAGIVHRDLKPSNIKLTKSGVKLLDFGLARTQAPLVAGSVATLAPTTPAALTQQGTILGTLQYMSPEQLEGQEADARSDIFAFGAVLYEMLTGTKAFAGKSQASLVGAILRDTPRPVSALQPAVPARLDQVVTICLEKDPQDRWQSMRDLKRELEWLASAPPGGQPSLAAPVRRPWPWVVTAVIIVAALGAGWWIFGRAPLPKPPTRLVADLPPAAPYGSTVTPGRNLAITPDGRTLVYVAGRRPVRQLYRRALDQLTPQPIPGSDGAFQPFFSPDGQSVAFFTIAGELKRVPLIGGGPSITIARNLQNGQWAFGTWRADNVIVFSAFERLLQVSADGGEPTPVTSLTNGTTTDLWHQYPVVVPSTGDIVFTVYTAEARFRLDILRWGSKQRAKLVDDARGAVLTPSGGLLFSRDGVVMAAAFDATSGTVSTPGPIPESVVVDQQGIAQLAVAGDGTLAYVPTDPAAPVPILGWTSRAGVFTDIAQLPPGMDSATLSPDGTLAILSAYGTSKVSIFDVNRQVSTPLNLAGRQVETVAWHPDGKHVTLGGAYLSLFDLDTAIEARLTPIGRPKRFPSWTPDGQHVVFMTFEPSNDLYTLSLRPGGKEPEGSPRALIATPGPESNAAIAPDGRWIAYRAVGDQASGRTDVYIARFPEGTGRIQVTNNGGGPPFWSRTGDELFFSGPPGVLQSVSVTLGERAQVGSPRTLFPLGDLGSFSVSPDGSRFLAIKEPAPAPPRQIVIVQNWLAPR